MKKIKLIIPTVILVIISVITVNALSNPSVDEIISVEKKGQTTHGDYNINISNTNLGDSGYKGELFLSVDKGYYVSDLSVKFDDQELELGFEAGAENGNFFRKYNFSPLEREYQFVIPEEVSSSNKINIEITYSKKSPIDITYANYTSNQYDDNHVYDVDNYDLANEQVLVTNYLDGDLVLRDDMISNGSLLKLQFENADAYNYYKSINREDNPWIRAEAGFNHEDYLTTGEDACFNEDDNYYCLVVVKKDFSKATVGSLSVGYTELNVFTPDYLGFSVETDIQNFNDILHETGSEQIGFTETKKEANIEIFYGTKKLKLTKKTPEAIVNDNQANRTGSVREFDNVTGEGYGYSTSYEDGVATISINTYYQDKYVISINLLKNGQNVLNGPVKLNLSRFAFAGNGGQLLEVDSQGRNCHENNNGNTCNQGVYYSTQYRGILSAFYVAENTNKTQIDSLYRVNSVDKNNKTIELNDSYPEEGYKRDEDFNPHAIALFYDENDMIVETKDFDLNADTNVGGFVSKSTYNSVFSGYTSNLEVTKNYLLFDHNDRLPIKYVSYFGNHLDETIMHEIVLIGKDEAREKNIKKIALFLVNGEIEENTIPELTYGIGEGRIMEIRGGGE